MSRVDEYRRDLRELDDWEPYLLEHSRLPGPRANLELLHAAADEGDAPRFMSLLRHGPAGDPAGGRAEFLAACGATGLGESIARGDDTLWPALRAAASDPRWRVREGVAMGLQRIGDRDTKRLLDHLDGWIEGGPLERRAVAAALCEPRLLADGVTVRRVLDALDRLTASLEAEPDRRGPDVRVLRQALGYCWSVAIAADPASGIPRFERWAEREDPDVRWIVRENLKKNRLRKVAPEWVAELTARKVQREAS